MADLVSIWTELEDERQQKDSPGLLGRPIDPSLSLSAAVEEGRRLLLVPLGAAEQGFEDLRSRGVQVLTQRLEMEGGHRHPYLIIRSLEGGGGTQFHAFCLDLLAQARKLRDPVQATRITLERWRHFWGGGERTPLSPQQQRGLFGELWFLCHWVLPHGTAQVRAWQGPAKERFDFQWQGAAVEVKCTASTRGHRHVINGLEQLLPPVGGGLSLFSLRLREELSGSETLPGLVAQVWDLLAEDPVATGEFASSLAAAGYRPEDEVHYTARYSVMDGRLYAVGESFPRLPLVALPPGVSSVSYEIDLDGFGDLVVATLPVEWAPGMDEAE